LREIVPAIRRGVFDSYFGSMSVTGMGVHVKKTAKDFTLFATEKGLPPVPAPYP
jgi:hypothetical protein